MSLSIRLSHFLVDLFAAKGWIEEDGEIAYVVGLDVIFSTLTDWMAIGILGLIRGRLLEAFVYLLFVLTVRRYSGGYHASTRAGCFSIFVGFYLLTDLFTVGVFKNAGSLFLIIYSVSSMIMGELIFYLFVPIGNDRKKYTEEWLISARKKAFICLNVWYCLAVSLAALRIELFGQIIAASNIVVILILMRKRREGK
ncbi:MAG: accessory gene regulator B family protein [Lachnospiraceae bacterium]|nr:accessory gene regulator B family protein [Lachnospiraceae bacterium]